jgi:dolichol-phosphate mannosyltransferase
MSRLGSMTAFGLVGLSGLGVNQLLLWALVELAAVDSLVAAVLASAGSTTSNFLLNDLLVFRRRAAGASLRRPLARYAGFLALTALTLPVRLPVFAVLTSGLHLHYLVANLGALLAVFALRYAVSDGLIWGGLRANREAA